MARLVAVLLCATDSAVSAVLKMLFPLLFCYGHCVIVCAMKMNDNEF